MIIFSITYLVSLAIQAFSIPTIQKNYGDVDASGIYFRKLVVFPIWFTLTFVGTLGLWTGLALFATTFILWFVGMVVYMIKLSLKDPIFAQDFANKPEYKDERNRMYNYMSLFWGLILLIGSVTGALTLA